jgi:hypothetical protein
LHCFALRQLVRLEQLYILHLPAPSSFYPGSGGLSAREASLAAARPHLHARFTSLSEDEFAAVSSQEAEAEDEALRINAAAAAAGAAAAGAAGAGGLPSVPEQGESTPNTPRPSLQRVGSEVFGRSPTPPPSSSRGSAPSSAALSDDEEEGDELLEQLGSVSNAGVPLPHLSPPQQQGRAARSPAARTLFPSAAQQQCQQQQQQQSQPRWSSAASSSSSSSSVLGMDNHAYGFSLVCIYKLSLLFASLPLAAAAAVMEGSGGSFAGSNPREVLHKDLLLLASHELTPEQKLRWIAHMMRHHSDWLV